MFKPAMFDSVVMIYLQVELQVSTEDDHHAGEI